MSSDVDSNFQVVFPIRMSKLLKAFEKNETLEFICHAAELIYKKKTGSTAKTVKTSTTFTELRRILPEHIMAHRNGTGVLQEWTTNLPTNLQVIKNKNSDRDFRIAFLKFAIEKIGDKKIKFELHDS